MDKVKKHVEESDKLESHKTRPSAWGWLKNFSSLHERIAQQLQEYFVRGNVPTWMTEGSTVLIMKDIIRI